MSLARIKELRNRVASLSEKVNQAVISVIRENEDWIIALNLQQLNQFGINNKGQAIQPPYTVTTIRIKQKKMHPTNRVTLRDTGAFQESFFLDIGLDQFEVKASDEKTEELLNKYGRDVLGLTDENIRLLIEEKIHPVVVQTFDQIMR